MSCPNKKKFCPPGAPSAHGKDASCADRCLAGCDYGGGRRSLLRCLCICTGSDRGPPPIFVDKIPASYRDWKLISVAHEEGNLKSLGAILGNNVAIKAFREKKLPFPDGTIIAALHWQHSPSEENNKIFGRSQSYVPGHTTNVQFMVKDSKKYAATGGWGFGHFNERDGKPAEVAFMKSCYACHQKAKNSDLVFTRYAL
jgi:Cytochrome P460